MLNVARAAFAFRAREESKSERASLRAAEILGRLPEPVAVLRREFGVEGVRLFGSLATRVFHGESDLDLLVHGLCSKQHIDAMVAVAGIVGCTVDLVRVQEASKSLLDRVDQEGIDL